jgi:hypothetical protein
MKCLKKGKKYYIKNSYKKYEKFDYKNIDGKKIALIYITKTQTQYWLIFFESNNTKLSYYIAKKRETISEFNFIAKEVILNL